MAFDLDAFATTALAVEPADIVEVSFTATAEPPFLESEDFPLDFEADFAEDLKVELLSTEAFTALPDVDGFKSF